MKIVSASKKPEVSLSSSTIPPLSCEKDRPAYSEVAETVFFGSQRLGLLDAIYSTI